MHGSRWQRNGCQCHCHCCNRFSFLNNVDYEARGFKPLFKASDFTHPSTWPSFADLPPPDKWYETLKKVLEAHKDNVA